MNVRISWRMQQSNFRSISCFRYISSTVDMDKIRILHEADLKKMTKEQLVKHCLAMQNIHDLTTQKCHPKTDFLQCKYRHVAFKVAYLGWDLDGLQANVGKDTVEGAMKQALIDAGLADKNLPIRFSKAGRTDKGVSAFVQVLKTVVRTKLSKGDGVHTWRDPKSKNCASNKQLESMEMKQDEEEVVATEDYLFITEENDMLSSCRNLNKPESHSVYNLQNDSHNLVVDEKNEGNNEHDDFNFVGMLNKVLPSEIRVLGWLPTNEAFSARYHCLERSYHYYFVRGDLNVIDMDVAAKQFIGTKDFQNFCRFSKRDKQAPSKSFVKTITSFDVDVVSKAASWQRDLCCAKVTANSFLYQQVRHMMSVLFLIGLGKENIDLISELLNTDKICQRPGYNQSPSYPLVLVNTKFNGLRWRIDEHSATQLFYHFQAYWTSMICKTQIVQDLLMHLKNDTDTVLTNHTLLKDVDDEPKTCRNLFSTKISKMKCSYLNYGLFNQPCEIDTAKYTPILKRTNVRPSFHEIIKNVQKKLTKHP